MQSVEIVPTSMNNTAHEWKRIYLTIRLIARVFYEQLETRCKEAHLKLYFFDSIETQKIFPISLGSNVMNKVQLSWLSLTEYKGLGASTILV